METEDTAKSAKVDDRIEEYQAKTSPIIALKDHKMKFRSNYPYRLTNSCKSQLGKGNKNIVEKVNRILTESLGFNQ